MDNDAQSEQMVCICGKLEHDPAHSTSWAMSGIIGAHQFEQAPISEAALPAAGAESPKRLMRLPYNSNHPDFKETHLEDEWCAKAGCTLVPERFCHVCKRMVQKCEHFGPVYTTPKAEPPKQVTLKDAVDQARKSWQAEHGNCSMCDAGDKPIDGWHRGVHICGNATAEPPKPEPRQETSGFISDVQYSGSSCTFCGAAMVADSYRCLSCNSRLTAEKVKERCIEIAHSCRNDWFLGGWSTAFKIESAIRALDLGASSPVRPTAEEVREKARTTAIGWCSDCMARDGWSLVPGTLEDILVEFARALDLGAGSPAPNNAEHERQVMPDATTKSDTTGGTPSRKITSADSPPQQEAREIELLRSQLRAKDIIAAKMAGRAEKAEAESSLIWQKAAGAMCEWCKQDGPPLALGGDPRRPLHLCAGAIYRECSASPIHAAREESK